MIYYYIQEWFKYQNDESKILNFDKIFLNVHTAPNHQLFERQNRCSIFTVLCYFRYFVRE